MNPDSTDEKLDLLLQTWSRDHAADGATLDRLQRSIASAVAVSPPVSHSRRSQWVVVVCALAASLVMAVIAGTSRFGRTDVASSIATGSAADERTKRAPLWSEIGRLFGSDLDWACDLDGELLLGMHDSTGTPTADVPVCVSLTLLVFNRDRATWVNSWSGRMLCRGGSTVDFASADKRSSGSVWVQSRPDGKFAVSHWLSWRDHPEWNGPIDATVSSELPQIVLDQVVDGQRIRIVQQVWRALPNKGV